MASENRYGILMSMAELEFVQRLLDYRLYAARKPNGTDCRAEMEVNLHKRLEEFLMEHREPSVKEEV